MIIIESVIIIVSIIGLLWCSIFIGAVMTTLSGISPMLFESLLHSRGRLIIDRYYWVQFYNDGPWQLGRWSKFRDFDTAIFHQDWNHPEPIRWILIPSPEELYRMTILAGDQRKALCLGDMI